MRGDPYMPDDRFVDVDEDDYDEYQRINAEEDRVLAAIDRVDAYEQTDAEASDA